MSNSGKLLEMVKKLRNGDKVKCDLCNEGYMVTPYDYKTSHYFECSHCKEKLIID